MARRASTFTLSFFFITFSVLLTSHSHYSNAYSLSTQNRWIMDESTGERSKLVCGNWAGHLQPMIPEGLDKRPLKDLVSEIVKHNFNCVRLTYAIYMWTRYLSWWASKLFWFSFLLVFIIFYYTFFKIGTSWLVFFRNWGNEISWMT